MLIFFYFTGEYCDIILYIKIEEIVVWIGIQMTLYTTAILKTVWIAIDISHIFCHIFLFKKTHFFVKQ